MNVSESLGIIKALADPSRLLLLHALLDQPQCVEELAQRLQLAASTVSFHLKKLESARLVVRVKDQYYAMYSANPDMLDMTLRELTAISDVSRDQQAEHIEQYRQKVLHTFFQHGRLRQLPVQKKKRRIILEAIVSRFETGRTYTETEVNNIIAEVYDDYCTIRRECLAGELLARDDHTYWVMTETTNIQIPSEPAQIERLVQEPTINHKAVLKRRYKENPPPAGIFQITNRATGKVLIGKGLNVQGILNSQQFQLQTGVHRNQALQQDWNQYGAGQFTFEIVDYLKPSDDPQQDLREELAALEELWLVKLQPYGDKGYNKIKKGAQR